MVHVLYKKHFRQKQPEPESKKDELDEKYQNAAIVIDNGGFSMKAGLHRMMDQKLYFLPLLPDR